MNKQDELNDKIFISDTNNESNNFVDMDALVNNLKKEDARTLGMMKNFKWIFYIMIIVYSLLMIVNPDPELKLYQRISGLCYVVSFAFFAALFRKYHSDFRKIDYSVSSSEMLNKAAERYKFGFVRYLYVLPSLLLMDVGLTISEFYRWTSIEPLNRILIVQAFFIPLILISGFIGYLNWRKRQKPLHDGALQMLKELTEI